jgi:hypothetical protein
MTPEGILYRLKVVLNNTPTCPRYKDAADGVFGCSGPIESRCSICLLHEVIMAMQAGVRVRNEVQFGPEVHPEW